MIDWGRTGGAVPSSVGVSCGRADSTRYVRPFDVSASVRRLADSGSYRTFLMPSRWVGRKAAGSQIDDRPLIETYSVTELVGARVRTPLGSEPPAGL
jgi:hypothetical protein